MVDDLDDSIAVVDDRDRTVKTYTCEGELVSKWKRNMFIKPRGLAITQNDHFVVTDVSDKATSKINIFGPQGRSDDG